MLDNYIYDLMMQLTQEHKSLWRIRGEYMKNAERNEACLAFWKKMQKDKEDHIAELTALLKKNLG